MTDKDRAILHEIACILFPHVRDREEAKKKSALLKDWTYNPVQFCFERKGTRLSTEFVAKSKYTELEEMLKYIEGMNDRR